MSVAGFERECVSFINWNQVSTVKIINQGGFCFARQNKIINY